MAEVIGSLAAVIQLVSCASKFARELRKFSKTVGPLSDEAQKCAIQANNFSYAKTRDSATSTASKISETIQVASKVIVIDPTRLDTSTTGYVRSDSGEMRHTTAVQVESIDGAIISILKAKELGLDVEEYDNDEEVWIAFGDSTSNKSVGRAALNWRKSAESPNSMSKTWI
ncbi:hypothetical protein C8034_v009310 [Colletotrichum sidae]|uniref:Fungal N-terminal domain-containing protein n=1 Tax=Colletotrichum sidae TaxID=1347389 RepID=A0A4R8TLS0_9PEZI|nr:hypothetical protein C8034_v009310 [Colletotrichum sidae]